MSSNPVEADTEVFTSFEKYCLENKSSQSAIFYTVATTAKVDENRTFLKTQRHTICCSKFLNK